MKQGEIWMAKLDPTLDSEQKGTRPVVIISGNAMNNHFGLVIICPISSRIKHFIGDLILLPTVDNGLSEKSEVLVFQVRTISKKRLIHKTGQITENELSDLITNLNKILKY